MNTPMPKGIHNAYWFQVFNSLSYPAIIGMPMLLFCKRFGAGATVLGVVAAMAPLLNILQIPAANYVEKVGYRKFVLRGWTARSAFILFFAVIAILPASIDATTKIVLCLCLLFFFNASRGFSVCGMLPWMTQLVPEEHRATYISRDQMLANLSVMLFSLGASFYLSRFDSIGSFAFLFVFSFAAAMVSIFYLKRIPDVPVPAASRSPAGVPWKAIVNYRPFRTMLAFNCLLLFSWCGSGILQVMMLRGLFNFSDANFLLLGVITSSVFVVGMLFLPRLINRAGNKPFFTVSLLIQVLHMAGWTLVAAGIFPFTWTVVVWQQGIWGLAMAFFALANSRMVMSIVPEMGRSHFFAVFSVGQSLMMGLSPVLWGMMIDSLRDFAGRWHGWHWNPYSLGYAVSTLIIASAVFILVRVEDAKAMTTEEFFRELLVNTPARAISRILTRRPPPL